MPLMVILPLPISSNSVGVVSGTVVVSVVLLVVAITGVQTTKVNATTSTHKIAFEKIFDLVFIAFCTYSATTSAVKVMVAVYSPARALPQSALLIIITVHFRSGSVVLVVDCVYSSVEPSFFP